MCRTGKTGEGGGGVLLVSRLRAALKSVHAVGGGKLLERVLKLSRPDAVAFQNTLIRQLQTCSGVRDGVLDTPVQQPQCRHASGGKSRYIVRTGF